MMKKIMKAVERLRSRFDFGASKKQDRKRGHASTNKRPRKRRRRR